MVDKEATRLYALNLSDNCFDKQISDELYSFYLTGDKSMLSQRSKDYFNNTWPGKNTVGIENL